MELWSEDRLDRRFEAQDLIRFLLSRAQRRSSEAGASSYVLNLDAPWGYGKTFFLRNLAGELRSNGHVVAEVNAWETDFFEEPLLVILSAIDDALRPHLGDPAARKIWRNALQSGGTLAVSLGKNVLKKTVERYAGTFVQEAAEVLEDQLPADRDLPSGAVSGLTDVTRETLVGAVDKLADRAMAQLLAAFRTEAKSIATFKENLSRVAISFANSATPRRIFILIDELDRCRPTYALKMLEAVKHLFSAQGVIFIVATDADQLSESIKSVYGANFDGMRYLYRFFDRRYKLRQPSRTSFLEVTLGKYGLSDSNFFYPHQKSETASHFIDKMCQAFDLSLRDIEQCIDIISTINDLWNKPTKINLLYMFPLVVFFHLRQISFFDALASGQYSGGLTRTPVVWTTNHRQRDGSHTTKKYDMATAITQIASAAMKPLAEVELTGTSTPPEQWVYEMSQQEVRDLHGGKMLYSPPQHSILKDYPKMVQLAVRFDNLN